MTNTEQMQKAVLFAIQNALVGILQTKGKDAGPYSATIKHTAREIAGASEMALHRLAIEIFGNKEKK